LFRFLSLFLLPLKRQPILLAHFLILFLLLLELKPFLFLQFLLLLLLVFLLLILCHYIFLREWRVLNTYAVIIQPLSHV
jgi:hypothetical protein